MILAALALLLAQADAADTAVARLDAGFVCPEALPSDAARAAALKAFVDGYAAARPVATPQDLLAYRRLLLETHGCRDTLAKVEAADRAVRTDADVLAQAWLPLPGAGPQLSVSVDHLAPALDPRAPGERAVTTYARVVFPEERTTDVTRTRYDELVSHATYYCATGRYALIENDYFDHGAPTLRDRSPQAGQGPEGQPFFAFSAIPPGSLNARVAQFACASAKGRPG